MEGKMKDNDEIGVSPELAKIARDYRDSIIREGNKIMERELKRYPEDTTGLQLILALKIAQAQALGISISITARTSGSDPDRHLEELIELVTGTIRKEAVQRYEKSRPDSIQ
jgi:hypothetical protein